jgi:hypothetical protein
MKYLAIKRIKFPHEVHVTVNVPNTSVRNVTVTSNKDLSDAITKVEVYLREYVDSLHRQLTELDLAFAQIEGLKAGVELGAMEATVSPEQIN